jgi:hypothetical protein
MVTPGYRGSSVVGVGFDIIPAVFKTGVTAFDAVEIIADGKYLASSGLSFPQKHTAQPWT